jgi:asparagine synthase (glutamine-hydrolysing)
MPGLSILKGSIAEVNLENRKLVKDNAIISALDSIIYDNSYTQEVLLNEESFLVICTKYREYPTTVFENDDYWVCIEGKIYGKDASIVERDVNALLFKIFFSGKNSEKGEDLNIHSWLSTTDGEFIIYALNKKNKEFVIINDVLGRLPIYYYDDDTKVIISRELSLVAHIISHNDGNDTKNEYLFDKMAIAQYLLFGFALDKKTLLKGVSRMQPGSVARLRIDQNTLPKATRLVIENLFLFTFEKKEHYKDSLKENTDTIVSLFTKACRDRVNPEGNNTISLSGGFDSRLVAAFFYRNKITCRCITYMDSGWKPLLGDKSEREIASRVSDIFRFDWKNYGSIKPSNIDHLTLLMVKPGSIHLGYSFMLPILEILRKEYTANAIFFTGHGGNRILVNLLPSKKSKSLHELALSIIDREGFLSIHDVSELVQISEEEIIDELKSILKLYPEGELDQKYVHFIIYGILFKKFFEVEDTERLYFWSTSPYYSVPLFTYIMGCSDNNKSSRAFHRELLNLLSPSTTALESSDYGCSIVSNKFRLIIPFKSLIFRYHSLKRVAALIIRKKDRDAIDNKMVKCIKEDIKSSNYLSKYFSVAKLRDLAGDPARHGLHAVYHLFTIISLIEKTYAKECAIEKYYASPDDVT